MRAHRTYLARIVEFWRNERGATLVEFAIALALFLLLLFGMIDFGRLAYHRIAAEKAMHIAARLAAVRPAACAGLPSINARGSTSVVPKPRFGTSCGAGANICATQAALVCTGSATNATASEIWARINAILPPGVAIDDLQISYTFDPNLGFLGGPYVPLVTAELVGATFTFISPLGQLASLAGGSAPSGLGGTINFPSMSVSLPGEDLASGTNG
ncbi:MULTISPECIES: TadE/TadG family type IV pilus assembly protein [Falsihalocynthiibacter]|uniref:TadE/TadG family type IV pilus assembly protein n=1 Tax=Falsihalocynthiibacter TaxID=2854182 RepID=UPI0030017766